jgi:hypothetical protein
MWSPLCAGSSDASVIEAPHARRGMTGQSPLHGAESGVSLGSQRRRPFLAFMRLAVRPKLGHTALGTPQDPSEDRQMAAQPPRLSGPEFGDYRSPTRLDPHGSQRLDASTLSSFLEVKMLETIMEPVGEYRFELNLSIVALAGMRLALDRLLSRLRPIFLMPCGPDRSLSEDRRQIRPCTTSLQEAADNAIKHTSCSLNEIAIKSRRDGLILEVRANGRRLRPRGRPQ